MVFTTEVAIFKVTDIFRDDPSVSTPAWDIVLKADGVNTPVYYGTQVENPNTGYIFVNWANYEAHMAFINSPAQPAAIEVFKPLLNSEIEMYHVEFSSSTIALEQPVTEVLILTLKAPENRTRVVDILSKLSKASEEKFVFGQTHEDENKYIALGGWPTVEAHQEVAAKPEVTEELGKLTSLATQDHYYHAKLLQYSGL